MTTAVELPKTIRRALMVGFNIELVGNAPVEVPITHFSYNAALDDNDKPIGDYIGVYQGVIQMRGPHGYFWKALAFEMTPYDPTIHSPFPESLSPEDRKGLCYDVRFVELLDLTSVDGRAQTRRITPVFVFIEKPVADTNVARNNAGELKPEWTLTQYKETTKGDRTAELISSTGAQATLHIDRTNRITEIFVQGKCLKSLNENRQLTYTGADRMELIAQLEYSYMVQRYSKALTGKDNPVVVAGLADLSEIAAPTYVVEAEQAQKPAEVPEAALLDCDSSDAVLGVDLAVPGADVTAQTSWTADSGSSDSTN